jgi:glutamate racemase
MSSRPFSHLVPGSEAMSECIGVFDSGVGGLSVLRALHARLPQVPMTYVGDVAYAPYGEKSELEIIRRCERIVEHLVAQGARLVVVACNTATVIAIDILRKRWPELTFVGVEPGIKPAVAQTRKKRIALMSTPATAASARVRRLIDEHARGIKVHVQACPGLAGAIERGVLKGPELRAVLGPPCASIRAMQADTVVLGCTHYPFVANLIQEMIGGDVTLIDTASAIAQRTASVWRSNAPDEGSRETIARVFSTGASKTMQMLLAECPGFEHVEVEALNI